MNNYSSIVEGDADPYGDSDFLAQRDLTIGDFRASEKETKHKITEKMLELRHNKEYNKHLLSVYTKAKSLFDTMVEEHRAQLHYLEEIYRHINNMIRENLSKPAFSKTQNRSIIAELMKDKKRIGKLLKKMRNSYEKLSNVDTTIGVTIEKMDKIIELDEIQHDDDTDMDADDDAEDTDASDDAEEYASDDADDDDEDDEDEDDEDEDDASDDDDDEDDASDDDEDEEDASDEHDDEDEDEDEEDASDEHDDDEYASDDTEEAEDVDDNDLGDDDVDDDDGIIAIY